MLLHLFVEDK